MKTRTTTSADGRITLHHNAEWRGTVEVVINGREGTHYGATMPAELLLSGDYDRGFSDASEVSERLMRRATAMAVASAARSAVEAITTATIMEIDV